jgi:hypothetical protein
MICSATEISAICEICVVIRFLYAENMRAAEIHPELCVAIYGQNVIGERTVRELCRMLKKISEQMLMMKSKFKMFTKNYVSDGTLQFQNFGVNFHKFHILFCMRLSHVG